MSRRNRNPVPGSELPIRGASGSWLFKRSSTHFHQGLDIGKRYGGDHPEFRDREAYEKARLTGKLAIVSVTNGKVWDLEPNDVGTYGRVIVIKSEVNGRDLWFLYSHCAAIDDRLRLGVRVHEQQVIGYVGHSGTAGALNPHLHFEIATEPLRTGAGPEFETTPTVQRRRIDPYAVLEELGPFSGKQVHFVTNKPVTPTEVIKQHLAVETSTRGGFFPLGANNIWHGGVHVAASAGSTLVAPFDGEIVALRLDPNPTSAIASFGSANFILVRSELDERLYNALRGENGGNTDPAFIGPQASGVDDGELDHDDGDDDVGCCGDGAHVLEAFDDPPKQGDDPKPPEVLEHSERVIFTLLMHVGSEPFTDALAKTFPWLTAVRVGPGKIAPPAGAEDAKAAFEAHEADAKEAASHHIGSKVGGGKGKEADIAWVEKRLIRFDFLDEATGKESPQLTEAIRAFEAEHVFEKTPQKITGVVVPGKKTDKQLRKTRRDLGLDTKPSGPESLDPMFVARAGNLDGDGVAEVISGLKIQVRAGDKLWVSDRARGFNEAGTTTLHEQVHWEIFSEERIFIDGVDGWASIDDPNDDLTTDAPQALIDLIDKPTAALLPPFTKGPDGIVSLAELTAFYGSPEATFLRRRQCRFRAEWGLDLDKTVAALVKTFPNIDTFRDDLVPYQWWQHAADVLPPGPPGEAETHVWHYNPIEFMALFQRALDSIAPPKKKDPRKFGDVEITVVNRQGGRLGKVALKLVDAAGTEHTAKTKKPDSKGRGGGEVKFFDVAKGTATLVASYKDAKQSWTPPATVHAVAAAAAEDDPFVTTSIALKAEVDGAPPPLGKIVVTVRLFGAIHKTPVVVEAVDDSGVVIRKSVTSGAKADLADLPFGKYQVRCEDGQSDVTTLVIDSKSPRNVVLRRFPPAAKLKVRVTHEGVGADGIEVHADTAKGNLPAVSRVGFTDPSGEVIFDVFQGKYVVRVGKASKGTNVAKDVLNEVHVKLTKAPPPTSTGILFVNVPAIANLEGAVELCFESHPDVPVATAVPADGVAEFVAAEGSYVARYGDGEVEATVTAGSTTTVEIEP